MRPIVEFDPGPHAYRLNGRAVPSVTQALSMIEDWSHVDPVLLARAAKFGNHVHEAVHLFCMGTLHWHALDPNLRPYVQQFSRFLSESKAEVLASELIVGSARYGYAGTLDLILSLTRLKRRRAVLCDVKSGLVPATTVGPQSAAYAKAASEGFWPEPLLKRYVLQLASNSYKFKPLDERSDFDRFLSCLNAWKLKHGR